MNGKFKVGDRVKRSIEFAHYIEGTVTEVYSRPAEKVGYTVLGPYPELYTVEWDGGRVERGFLPHSLQEIKKEDKT